MKRLHLNLIGKIILQVENIILQRYICGESSKSTNEEIGYQVADATLDESLLQGERNLVLHLSVKILITTYWTEQHTIEDNGYYRERIDRHSVRNGIMPILNILIGGMNYLQRN